MLDVSLRFSHNATARLQAELQFPEGISVLFGPSGSGKSTLLKMISGQLTPDSGSSICFRKQVWLNNETNLAAAQRRIGMVHQGASLFEHLNLQQHINLITYLHGIHPEHRELATACGVSDEWLQRLPHQISGGQRHRFAIFLALLQKPQLLILDEACTGLARQARLQLLAFLRDYCHQSQLPVIMTSHHADEVAQCADHLVLVQDHRIVAAGSVAKVTADFDSFAVFADQTGAVVEGQLIGHEEPFQLSQIEIDGERWLVPHIQAEIGSICRLQIPARDVSISATKDMATSLLNRVAAEVDDIKILSPQCALIRLRLQDQYLLARITYKSLLQLDLQPGHKVFAQVKSVALN